MKKIYLLIIFCFMWLSGNAQWYKEYRDPYLLQRK